MNRKLAFGSLFAALLAAAGIAVFSPLGSSLLPGTWKASPVPADLDPAVSAPDSIVIGSYNIQAFGPTKLGRPNTLAALAAVGARFDVLAIQEVGSNSSTATDATCEEVMEEYLRRVDAAAGGPRYAYVRANQYAILYRSDLFELRGSASYAEGDFAYPPFAAYLGLHGAPLDFVIVTVHVRPAEAEGEIASLSKAIETFSARYSEKDVIVLGDFNADGSYYDEGEGPSLAGFPVGDFLTVIPNDADTTVGPDSFAYDRMELSSSMAEDWLGTWKVLRPGELFDLSLCEGPSSRAGTEAALSDHYPISAEFATGRDTD